MKRIKLFEAWVHAQALNEAAPFGKLDFAMFDKAMAARAFKKEDKLTEDQNLKYEALKAILKNNGVIFSIPVEDAALILTNYWIFGPDARFNDYDAKTWFNYDGEVGKPKVLKLNPSPDDPAKILSKGIFSEDEIVNPGDLSASSDYKEVALYCNNATLYIVSDYLRQKMGDNTNAGTPKGGSLRLKIDVNDGYLDWTREYGSTFLFYGTAKTTQAQSKQTVTTLTWEVPPAGKTIVKQLPGTMFATGAITLSDPKELDAAIAELKALLADKNTVLGSIEIESSASGDKPVDGKNGYPAGTKPGQYPLGKPYTVKTGETSGNAKLALGRGETIKEKLAGLSNDIKVKAVIQDGGDDAQYAKLIVTAKKAGGASEVYTTDELNNLVLKTKQTKDLASVNTLSVWKAASGSSYSD
jgi:hypothetical protein